MRIKEFRKEKQEKLSELKVETAFKLKYHNEELGRSICHNTTKKHNELVGMLCHIISDLENRIERLEKEVYENKN